MEKATPKTRRRFSSGRVLKKYFAPLFQHKHQACSNKFFLEEFIFNKTRRECSLLMAIRDFKFSARRWELPEALSRTPIEEKIIAGDIVVVRRDSTEGRVDLDISREGFEERVLMLEESEWSGIEKYFRRVDEGAHFSGT